MFRLALAFVLGDRCRQVKKIAGVLEFTLFPEHPQRHQIRQVSRGRCRWRSGSGAIAGGAQSPLESIHTLRKHSYQSLFLARIELPPQPFEQAGFCNKELDTLDCPLLGGESDPGEPRQPFIDLVR